MHARSRRCRSPPTAHGTRFADRKRPRGKLQERRSARRQGYSIPQCRLDHGVTAKMAVEMTSLWKPQNGFHRNLEISQRTRDSHIPTANPRFFKRAEEQRTRTRRPTSINNSVSRSPRLWWPVLKCRSVAGFQVSTEARAASGAERRTAVALRVTSTAQDRTEVMSHGHSPICYTQPCGVTCSLSGVRRFGIIPAGLRESDTWHSPRPV